MTEQNLQQLPTQAVVTAQFNVEFTKHGVSVQKIQDEINALEFTEENIPIISDLINKIKQANKVVDEKHKEGKAPYLEATRVWDNVKKSFLTINDGLLNQITPKYNALCQQVEQRRLEKEREKQRINAIKSGIESNILSFSTQIAQCQTNAQLISVERVINLEKSDSRKTKYMEFHLEAIEKYDSVLIPILKAQKDKIKERETIENSIKKAENENNAAKIDELTQKKEQVENEILQNQVNVQQGALETDISFKVDVAEEVLPSVSTVKRISFEIVDASVAIKKCPELLTIEIKHREAQKLAMSLKDAGVFKDNEEVVVNGIKFYVEKSYK
jgi:polyhydroxyalkanoate synthesis regulator phasin